MRRGFVGFMLGTLIFLVGCETAKQRYFSPPNDYVPLAKISVESRLKAVEITSQSIGEEVNRCVPPLNASSKNVQQLAGKLPLPTGTMTALGHASSAHQFLVRGTSSICLRQSDARHFILASDSLLDTVNPVGVPPDVQEEWYRNIALKLAQNGSVKVIYVFGSGGNASAVSYWFGTGQSDNSTLYYSQEFKKAGSWDANAYGLVFRHINLASISETKRNGVGRKSDFVPVSR